MSDSIDRTPLNSAARPADAANQGLQHIYWRSRRGMLELELKLVPFVRDEYADLSEAQQALYRALLDEEDWQIFDWLQDREEAPDPAMRELISKIRAHRGKL